MPHVGVTTPDAYRRVPAPRRRGQDVEDEVAELAPAAYVAYLHPAEGHSAEPLAGETCGMQGLEATVEARLPARLAKEDLPALAMALAEAYGPAPRLEILDGLRMVWCGYAVIRQVDAGDPERVRIHLVARD